MATYTFRSGRSITGLDAQTVGEELERIRVEHDGNLTPQIVVDKASDPESPLHVAFTWDDSEAAKRFRLSEARKVITSIKVFITQAARPTVAYYSVISATKGRIYAPAAQVMTDEDMRNRVLQEVRQFVESLERRYAHIIDISEILSKPLRTAG